MPQVDPQIIEQVDPQLLERVQSRLGASGASTSVPSLDISRQNGDQRVNGTLQAVPAGSLPEELNVRSQRAIAQLERFYEPSPIEREYQERLGDPTLRQFGYELFQAAESRTGPLTGEVSDNYVLGIGDELVVSFQGATRDSRTVRIDREGRLIVGQLRPIRAAGRPLGAVRSDLQAETRRTLLGTDVYVSLGSVRAITVFVGGEVDRPGQYQLTSLADVVSALAQAGGVRRSGSLRNVRVVRSGGGTVTVDLYGLLGIGAPTAVRLQDGDRVIVPVIGDTVAISGSVERPGIYELRGGMTVGALINYAGGPLRPRGNRIAVSRIAEDGSETLVRAAGQSQSIMSGDAVQVVGGGFGGVRNRIILRGFVANPGPRSLAAAPTVRDLLGTPENLRLGTYLPMAILIRRDPVTSARIFEPINLVSTLGPGPSVPLRSDDRLYIFGQRDIEFINRAAVRRIVLGQPNPQPQCRALVRLEALIRDTQSPRFNAITRGTFILEREGRSDIAATGGALNQASERQLEARLLSTGTSADAPATGLMANGLDSSDNQQTPGGSQLRQPETPSTRIRASAIEDETEAACPTVFEEEPELLPVLMENAVGVGGAVRRPGAYPVAGAIDGELLSRIAQGLTTRAEDVVLDVTSSTGTEARLERFALNSASSATISLRAGDDIRFNAAQPQYEPGGVLLTGEFMRPGLYTIKKGETLSQLVARAGGLTPLAYPYGAIVTRRSVRELQQEGFRRTARELNTALLAVMARRQVSSDALIGANRLIEGLTTVEAPGRVVVEADPRVLSLRPDLDTTLESGDAITMPKIPNFVVVLGDVQNPGALQFVDGKNVRDYLREAGGAQSTADDDRAFLVLPNGSAQPIRSSVWRRSGMVVPPGSTVIVPKNLDPLRTFDVVRDIATIFGQFATAIASVVILSRN